MKQEEYLANRVEKDLSWYSNKANLYKSLHISSRVSVIIISALITVLTSVEFTYKNLFIAILSTLIVVITGITELMKFKEQWYEYRR